MKQWTFVVAEGLKAHYASPEAIDLVVGRMRESDRRFVVEPEPRDEASVDMPGMVLAHRDWWVADIDGLTLRIPVIDFDVFLRQVRDLKGSSKFHERGWANVYGWNACISLSLEQYDTLHRMMEAQRSSVLGRAKLERERFERVLAEVNDSLVSSGGASIMSAPKIVDDPVVREDPIGGLWN